MKKLLERLKLVKEIPKRGLACFSSDTEVFLIDPPVEISEFYYRCDKHFHWEIINDLFEQKEPDYGIILISGERSEFYLVNGTKHKLIVAINTELQSRQSRGGSSQNRIARLGEQKRDIYVKQIVEEINKSYLKVRGIILAGIGELKDKVYESQLIDHRIKIIGVYTISGLDIQSFINGKCFEILSTESLKKERQILDKLVTLIETDTKRLIYGDELIKKHIDLIEELVIYEGFEEKFKILLKDNFNGKVVNISKRLPTAQKVLSFGGIIGILYYSIDLE